MRHSQFRSGDTVGKPFRHVQARPAVESGGDDQRWHPNAGKLVVGVGRVTQGLDPLEHVFCVHAALVGLHPSVHDGLDPVEFREDVVPTQSRHDPGIGVLPKARIQQHSLHVQPDLHRAVVGQRRDRTQQGAGMQPIRMLDGTADRDMGAAGPAEDVELSVTEGLRNPNRHVGIMPEDRHRIVKTVEIGCRQVELRDREQLGQSVPYPVPDAHATRRHAYQQDQRTVGMRRDPDIDPVHRDCLPLGHRRSVPPGPQIRINLNISYCEILFHVYPTSVR